MTISSSDILLKLATTAGVAGNANTSTPNASLGKFISTTQLTDNSLHNLFDAVSGPENAASDVEYRCLFIHNNHATLSYDNIYAFLASEVSGGAAIAIGVDTTAESAIAAGTDQALTVADENTAPVGVSFSAPVSYGTGVSLGNIPAGHCRAIWIRRTAANTAAIANDGVTLRLQGESL